MNHSNFLADFLTLEELALFFRAIDRLRDRVMFQLMYRFGLSRLLKNSFSSCL